MNKSPRRSTECCVQNLQGVLDKYRLSGITSVDVSDWYNPPIIFPSPARLGCQVVPIQHPLPGRDWSAVDERQRASVWEPGCAHRYSREIRLVFKMQKNTTPLMSGPCFIYFFFFILLAYSIDSDSMTHLTAPTDLVDGCHKQLSQVWQFNTEVLYSNRFCKQRVPHCVQNENDCRGPPSPFQGRSHLSAPSACRLSASVAPRYVVADVSWWLGKML